MTWFERIEGLMRVLTLICTVYVLVIFGWFIAQLITDAR